MVIIIIMMVSYQLFVFQAHRGISVFIVERGMEGFTIGKPLDKLGANCSGTCPLYFDNVKVSTQTLQLAIHLIYMYI